jgi:signal transduction histidine kinase
MPGSNPSSNPGPRPSPNELSQSVRLALLVRLVAILVSLAGLIGDRLTAQMFVAILLLGATSAAGLLYPGFLSLLTRHPLLAMADVLIVVAVVAVLGVDSPLALAALSTAFLIGLLYPMRLAIVLGPVLAITYAADASNEHAGETQVPFLLVYGLPVTFLCLVWIGHSVARIYQAQQLAERELAAFVQASATHDERARLAREMHDSLAKSLQGIAFGAAALPTWLAQDGPRAQLAAADLAVSANQAVQEARTLLTRMRTDEPLRPFHEVLEGVLTAWSAEHGHPLRTRLEPLPALSSDARYELLAAMREALENIRRHAPGAEVLVRLSSDEESGELIVSDRGPGFDLDIVPKREAEGHFGLRGMRERLQAIGGTSRLESVRGAGTTVTLRVPLADLNLLPRA